MRTAALLCVALVGCAGQMNRPLQTQAYDGSVLGCWHITTLNFKSPHVPNGTKVRLDSIPSTYEPGYNHLQRLTAAPAGVVEERNYWYISPGDRHLRMKLGTASAGISLDFVPTLHGDRMYGRADAGANISATRTACGVKR